MKNSDFRVILDTENEKINYKIRAHSVKKIPAIVILGKKEMDEETISIRMLGSTETKTIKLSEAIEFFKHLETESK